MPCSGIGFRVGKALRMPNAGSWELGEFDFMEGLDPTDVLYVCVEIATCQTSSDGVHARWNTVDGKSEIEIITPVQQDVYINMLVMYAA